MRWFLIRIVPAFRNLHYPGSLQWWIDPISVFSFNWWNRNIFSSICFNDAVQGVTTPSFSHEWVLLVCSASVIRLWSIGSDPIYRLFNRCTVRTRTVRCTICHCSTMADSPKASLGAKYCLLTLTSTTTSLHHGYQQRCTLHLPIGSNGTFTIPSA